MGDLNTRPHHSSHYNFHCHFCEEVFVRWTFPLSYQPKLG